MNECTVPQYWGINFQPPGSGNSAPPFIGADMTIVVDTGGFCSTFTTIAGAIAGKLLDRYSIECCTCLQIHLGALNGAAGGIFSLASLAC